MQTGILTMHFQHAPVPPKSTQANLVTWG